MQKYVANLSFEEYETGEVLESDPEMVADWVEAGWISPIDDRGDRIVSHDPDAGVPASSAGASVQRVERAAPDDSGTSDDD